MSDEMAEQRASEERGMTDEETKRAEEIEKRVWQVTLILDPETGYFGIQVNENTTKKYQLETMVAMAVKQLATTEIVKSVTAMMMKLLKAEGAIKGKKVPALKK